MNASSDFKKLPQNPNVDYKEYVQLKLYHQYNQCYITFYPFDYLKNICSLNSLKKFTNPVFYTLGGLAFKLAMTSSTYFPLTDFSPNCYNICNLPLNYKTTKMM